jgi:hypothetical protein
MQYVDIFQIVDHESHRVARCVLQNEEVICSGELNVVKRLQKGILSVNLEGSERMLYPKDGIVFLEQLRLNFRSGYVSATPVQETIDGIDNKKF